LTQSRSPVDRLRYCSTPTGDRFVHYRTTRAGRTCRDQYARAREEQADTLAAKIMTVVDGVEPEPGKVSKARLQFDAYRWHAGKLAPKKYGDRISHDVKGPGPNFQPAIYITVDGQPLDEFARLQPASEETDGVLLDGNGNIVRER
jgi:hypothetical protein